MQALGKAPQLPSAEAPTFERAFETDDGAQAVARAVAADATLVQDVCEAPWGQTTAYVSDPDGS